MNKIAVFLALFALLASVVFAQTPQKTREIEINEMMVKIDEEIRRLDGRVKETRGEAKIRELQGLINGHRARLAALQDELDALGKTAEKEALLKEQEEERGPWLRFEIGGGGGLMAGGTGVTGEFRFPLNYVFGPATTSLRIAGGLVQSEDAARKYAPVSFDLIFNLPPGIITGVENYVGAGINYTLLTTGPKQGTFGGELVYGIDANGFGGKLFAELGYAMLNTGFGPSHSGLNTLVGYRAGLSF